MEGMVLGYDSGGGVIRTGDGTRYTFTRADWKSSSEPVAGLKVDFLAEGTEAKEIYIMNPAAGAFFSTVSSMEKSDKTIPTLVYVCYVAAFLYGITMIVGVILAYIYRGNAEGTWYQSHYDYQISLFWKSLAGFVVGGLTFFFGVGMVIVLLTYIWLIVKIVKGWRCLAEGKPVL